MGRKGTETCLFGAAGSSGGRLGRNSTQGRHCVLLHVSRASATKREFASGSDSPFSAATFYNTSSCAAETQILRTVPAHLRNPAPSTGPSASFGSQPSDVPVYPGVRFCNEVAAKKSETSSSL